MVRVVLTKSFDKSLKRKFSKSEYLEIKDLLFSLKKDPYKGKLLRTLGSLLLKELRYGSFRFYFLTSHNLVKFVVGADLKSELIKFVRYSKKNDQVKAISDIVNSLELDDELD